MFFLALIQAALIAFLPQVVRAVVSIEVQGADFVNPKTGNRFYVVGIAYQPGGSSGYKPASGVDPLTDGAVCLRDAALMQRLGVNAIRVYNVDPDLNHDLCASIFNEAGIYMAIDVNGPFPNEALVSFEPWTSYDVTYLNRTFAVVEAFKNYPNTLLFFAGNEVINDVPSSISAPYIRAVIRDIKSYVAKHSTRAIPVGYSAADVRDVLFDSYNYLQCSTTGSSIDISRTDVFALNSYSWCGAATFQSSSYDALTSFFTGSSVPVFFSEYGCNQVLPRVFSEVQAIYGPQMLPVLSGSVVYEYTEEPNNYGLVNIGSDGSIQLRPDYDAFQSQLNKLNLTALESTKPMNTTNQPPVCASGLISTAGFPKNWTIPAQTVGIPELIAAGITNPNIGKIIPVTNTKVGQVVTQSNGQVLSGLTLTVLADDQSNEPSGLTASTTGSPSPTGTSSSTAAAATSSKAAGWSVEIPQIGPLVALILAFLGLL